MTEASSADLIHFTCHGRTNPPVVYLQIAESSDEALNLQITALNNPRFLIKDGSIIFANACDSSSAHPVFGEFMTFGWEFYKKGAAIFIGTLGTVPTDMAILFAQNFYKSLQNSLWIWKAYKNTKEQIQKEDNFMHLLYCLYGNPLDFPKVFFRLKKEEAKNGS